MNDKINVLVTVRLREEQLARLRAQFPRLDIRLHPAQAVGEISPDVWAEVEVLFTPDVLPDREVAPRLRWVQATSAGVDHILKHPLFEKRDIILTTASGIHAVTMAEYTLAMVLAFAHRLPTMIARQAAHDWPKDRFQLFEPRPVRGATLGIVGYGSIGRETARLAQAFGMEVLATKRDAMRPEDRASYIEPGTGDPEGALVNRLYPPEALKSMLKACDYVVILLPRTPATLGIFDAEAVAAMKPGAVLINLGRGGVVDEQAVLKALQSGALGGAAFDVFEIEPLPPDSPLWNAPNLIISPHIGGNMPDYLGKVLDVFTANLERYLRGHDLLNVVDWERGY